MIGSQVEVFRGYAFIVGAMKCGTSSLHYLLEQHPAIVMGRRKELDFFTRQDAPSAEFYEQAEFPALDKTKHAYTLDSSPNYSKTMIFPKALHRLAAMPGNKRLIYLMRNPVDRIESHLTHRLARGREINDRSIEVAVQTSQYASYLDLFGSLGLSEVLLVDFDELVANPVATAHRAFKFLGVDAMPVELDRPQNVRRKEDRYTTPEDDARHAELVRDDVRRLIDHYGFEPARRWGIV